MRNWHRCSENELEDIDGVVVEEALVDGDAQVPEVDHLGGLDVDVVHIDLALALGLHGESVKDALGGLVNVEDHDFVNNVGGGLYVEVLITNALCHRHDLSVVFVAHLSSLVVSVVVVLASIEVKMAGSYWVVEQSVGVDLKADWVLDGLAQGLTRVSEVQDGEDSATTDEGALLLVADWHDASGVERLHLELGVDVVPLASRWQVDRDVGRGSSDGVLDVWVADLGGDEDVVAEHELMVQVESQLILWELVPHRTNDGDTSLRGLKEGVVEIVGLSISLLDGSKDDALHTWALKPWLTHLGSGALLAVGAEEWIVDSELVELHEEVVRGNTSVAWDVVASVDNTGDGHAEELVHGELNILEVGVVAASGHNTVSLGAEEEASREKERSLLTAVTAEESLESGALLEGTVGVVDPAVLKNVAVGGHVSVVHWHADLLVILLRLPHGWLVHVVPDAVHVVGTLEDGWVEEVLPVVAGALIEEVNPDGLAGAAGTLEDLLGGGVPHEEVGDVVVIDELALLGEALLVHEVVVAGPDVRVGSNHEAAARVVHLLVHVHHVVLREALVVVLTILVVLSVLAIEPEDVDGEAEFGEIVVALGHLVGGVVLPLGEVVAERVSGWHGRVASQLRQLL